jgi:hypothetical protein
LTASQAVAISPGADSLLSFVAERVFIGPRREAAGRLSSSGGEIAKR